MASVRMSRYAVEEEQLPRMCMRCGDTATAHKTKTFSWHPPWVIVLIFVGLLPWLIVALILTKRMTVRVPLCDEHKGHWAWRAWVTFGGLALVVAAGFGGIIFVSSQRPGEGDLGGLVCLGAAGLGFIWLVTAAILGQTAIRPTEITDNGITLTNVSAEFADAFREERARRREEEDEEYGRRPRRRRREDDWDAPEDRPRRRDLPPDSFQERHD